MAKAYLQELDYNKAIHYARLTLRHNPNAMPANHVLAAALALIGQIQQAKKAIEEALKVNPDLTISNFADLYPVGLFKNFDIYIDGLRKAGLPE